MLQKRFTYMQPAHLWPTLAQVRSEFDIQSHNQNDSASRQGGVNHSFNRSSKTDRSSQLALLQDIARRRKAVMDAKFTSDWVAGKLVLIDVLASARPVLLTASLGGQRWSGLLVAPESDWASAFDVLLEPCDEPFDPACGMVQCWNPVVLRSTATHSNRVLGQLSSERLQAMLVAQADFADSVADCGIGDPGLIALRSISNSQTVLTGALTSEFDIRLEYQAFYRRLANIISR